MKNIYYIVCFIMMMSFYSLFYNKAFYQVALASEESSSCRASFVASYFTENNKLVDTNSSDVIERLFSKTENLKAYQDQDGYVKFADMYFDGDLYKTFRTVSRSLKKSQFKKLAWHRFEGSTEIWHNLPKQLYEDTGNIKDTYYHLGGYMLFTHRYFKGDLELAFRNVSARFSAKIIKALGWKKFQGKIDEVLFIQQLFSSQEKVAEFSRQRGYVAYAKRYFKGDLEKAFKNTSVVLDVEVFASLAWKKFHGKTRQFQALRDLVLNNGLIREVYVELSGYMWLAQNQFNGDLDKTFKNISAVLGKKEFSWLKWKKLYGTTKQLEALRDDYMINYPKHYIGLDNQKRIADKIYGGNTYLLYRNVSALKKYLFGKDNQDLFYQLNWLKQ